MHFLHYISPLAQSCENGNSNDIIIGSSFLTSKEQQRNYYMFSLLYLRRWTGQKKKWFFCCSVLILKMGELYAPPVRIVGIYFVHRSSLYFDSFSGVFTKAFNGGTFCPNYFDYNSETG